MCPVCLAAAVLVLGKVSAGGGVAAVVLRKVGGNTGKATAKASEEADRLRG